LGLYDPDRSQAVTYRGQPRSWSDAQIELRKSIAGLKAKQGRGLAILTPTVTSPTLSEQLNGETSSFKRGFPQARGVQYRPGNGGNRREGARQALGKFIDTLSVFGAVEVVVWRDAVFMGGGPAHWGYTGAFTANRRAATTGGGPAMNRLYVAESCPTVTGAAAD